jgi:activator of HSP90 ATPase
MTYDFSVSTELPAAPDAIYGTWMSSEGHTSMTGGQADVDPRIGGRFEAWDGYITGVTLSLEPGYRIVQSWRTADFTDGDEDSQIDVAFEPSEGGCVVVIRHTNVPDGHRGYQDGGWEDNYFAPMRAYFTHP